MGCSSSFCSTAGFVYMVCSRFLKHFKSLHFSFHLFSFPLIGLESMEPVEPIDMPLSLWYVTRASSDLRSPFQPQGIAAVWPARCSTKLYCMVTPCLRPLRNGLEPAMYCHSRHHATTENWIWIRTRCIYQSPTNDRKFGETIVENPEYTAHARGAANRKEL